MSGQWTLTTHQNKRGVATHLTIDFGDIQIADVFPGAGKYIGKVEETWVVEQAQHIVDTMNGELRAAIADAEEIAP